RDYELHSLDFSTAFLQGSLHEQIWLRRPPGFTGSFPPGTQWHLRRPVYGVRLAPRDWHDTLRSTLAALDFFSSSADPSLFVCLGSTPFFVLVYVDDLSHMVEQILTRFCFPFSKVQLTPLAVDHGLTAPPSDESFESTGPYLELVGCLMYVMTCTRRDLAYPLRVLARFVAPGRHRPSHWYAAKRVAKRVGLHVGTPLALGHVLFRGGRLGRREAEVYAVAMAAEELHWLCFLLTDLGERPRSPPVLFADNRSAVLLCEEPQLVGKAKRIQLHYLLLRELQQHGQALVQRVVSEANTAYVFTKALPPFRHVARRLAADRSRDSVSLFDHTSGTSPAPSVTADSATRSQWLTRDTIARLAIRNHLPLAECAHFGQHRTAQALYDVVVARCSSPATAALGPLLLPYLFPELSAFATVEDLVSHLRTSDARYRAALPAEDHFLSLDPTSLTVDLLEQQLLAAENSAVAVGAARGTPRTPFFEGCSPSPLAPSFASAAAVDVLGTEDIGAASASAKRRSSKGKGGRGGGGGSGSGGGGSSGGSGGSGGGGSGGSGGGSGGVGGGGGGSSRSGGSGSGGSGGSRTRAQHGGSRGGQRQRQQRQSKTPSPQQLCEWLFQRGASGGSGSCPYTMYALSASAEGDCYRCVPPDPGIDAAALGASESILPGNAPAEALHTFTLDSSA
ncbi:unnamed protein product, partial [Closterium sp. NIES-54]